MKPLKCKRISQNGFQLFADNEEIIVCKTKMFSGDKIFFNLTCIWIFIISKREEISKLLRNLVDAICL